MKAQVASALLMLAAVATQPAMAQGIGHSFFMRGSVVRMEGNEAVVCIGKADGAKVGQVLDVYRMRTMPGPQKGAGPGVRRELVGRVTVDHIFDDHFAHARVSNGVAAVNDIIELRRSR